MELCLANLYNIYPSLEVIVCDQSSYDDSADMVRTKFPWVKLIVSDNYGLANSFNQCLKEATGDYILYLGTDAFPEKDTISGLVNYFEDNYDVGAATVKLTLRDGSFDMDAHRGFPTPFVSLTHFTGLDRLFPKSKLFARYFLTFEDMDKEHPIDTCISHFLFVRNAVHNRIGLWDDKNFFLYGEDIDYCYRIKEAGYRIMYLPQFSAKHWKGASTGIRKSTKDVPVKADYYNYKGKKIPVDLFKISIQGFTADAMSAFYKKHYLKKYNPILSSLVLFSIYVLKVYRVNKQRISYILSRSKV